MANLNKVFLIGRLTRDPELRYTPSGTAVADFGLATNRTYTDQSGQKKENTCFVDLVIFGRRAEVVKEYLAKGQQVFIEGRLEWETWESKAGEKRSRHRVHIENFEFLGSAGGAGGVRRDSSEFRDTGGTVAASEPAVREPAVQEPGVREPAVREPASERGTDRDEFDLGDLPF